MIPSRIRSIAQIGLTLLLLFLMTACVKANLSVVVNPNGSGVVSIAMGLAPEAKDVVASTEFEDKFRILCETTLQGESGDGEITTSQWDDGDYAWVSYGRKFDSYEEINRIFSGDDWFTRFSLTRVQGFFKNQYLLVAELPSQAMGKMTTEDMLGGSNLSELIDARFTLKLPGEILDTDGVPDENDPSLLTWNMLTEDAVAVQAKSEAWNWVTLGIIAVVIALAGLIIVLIIRSRRNKVVAEIPPTKEVRPKTTLTKDFDSSPQKRVKKPAVKKKTLSKSGVHPPKKAV